MYRISGKVLFKGVVTPVFRAFEVRLQGRAVDLQILYTTTTFSTESELD